MQRHQQFRTKPWRTTATICYISNRRWRGRIPLHKAPNHFQSLSPSALLELPICTISQNSPLVRFTLHLFSRTKARGPYRLQPRHQNRRSCRLPFRSPNYDTSLPQERSPIRGGHYERHSVPILANAFAYLRLRSITELVLHRLHSIFPFCTHCSKRHSQTDAARPRFCQEASPSIVLF
jgi:hypothetical protein